MTQVTIRRIEDEWVAKAKAEAKRRGVSMNQVLLDALASGLGVRGEAPLNGLEKLANDSDFGPEWDEHLREINRVK